MVKPTCRQSSTSPMEHVSDTSSSSSSSASSKYRGVRQRKWGKWVSEIRLPNSRERIWLGSYDSEEKAAKAFDAALYCLRGPNANLNFPENPPEIIGGRSLNPSEIRVVATRFANQVYGHETSNNNNNDDYNEIYLGTESSSSVSVSAAMEIENAIQSSFLSMLDTKYQGMSDYGVYSPMSHHLFGDQLYTPPLPVDENIDDDQYGSDGFSQSSSFLWNF